MFGHTQDSAKNETKKTLLSSTQSGPGLAPSDYYQRYRKHYQTYLYSKSLQQSSALNDLYQACQDLCMSAMSGHNVALYTLQIPSKKLLLAHELPKTFDFEFTKRLQGELTAEASLETHLTLFMLFYSRRYQSTYSDYTVRFEEIYQALLNLSQCYTTDEDRQNPLIERLAKRMLISSADPMAATTLIASTWKVLSMEIMGLDPLAETLKQALHKKSELIQSPYPFRILSCAELEKTLSEFAPKNQKFNKRIANVAEKYIEAHVTKILCSAHKPNHYVLSTTADALKIASNPICYIDRESGIEIGRFEVTDRQIYFKGYGDSIHVKIEGALEVPACVFENPQTELTLSADWDSAHELYLAADVDRLCYQGLIHATQPLKLDIRGEMVLDSKSELTSDALIAIRSHALRLQGKITAKGMCQLEVETTLIAEPESRCHASGFMIAAGSLKDLRGQFTSGSFIKIDTSESIYLQGGAKLYAPSIIAVKAKSFMSTDQAMLKTEGSIHVEIQNLLIIDKESAWSAPTMVLRSNIFKNYSASIVADKASLYSKNEMINYSSGLITTTKSLQLTGGSVWNGGRIKFGLSLMVKLNKVFAHGLVNSSELYHLSEIIGRARITGDDVSITAAALIDCIGTMTVKNVQVATLAEFNIGLTVSKSTRKSRLIAIDIGLDLPNLPQICRDTYQFIELVRKGDSLAILNIITSKEAFFNVLSFIRWVIRTIFPIIGKPIDTAYGAIMFLVSVPKLFQECIRLYQLGRELEPSDVYSLIAIAGSLSSQAVSLAPQLEETEKSLSSSPPGESKEPMTSTEEKPEVISRLSENIPDLMLDFAAIFLPSCTNDALLSAKIGGFHSGASLLNRSLLSYEVGSTEVALSVTDIFHLASQHDGYVVAKNISSLGSVLDQSTTLVGSHLFTNVGKQHESSTVYAKDIFWQADEFTENADAKANQLRVEVKDHLVHTGHLVGSEEVFLHGGVIETGKESKLEGHSITVLAEQEETLSGSIAGHAALLQAKSGNLNIEHGAVIAVDEVHGIAGQTLTDSGVIKINETTPAPLDKDGKPKPVVSLVGKTVTTTVDSRIEAKEQTVVIHGDKNVELGGEAVAHHVHAEVKEGDLNLAQGSKITIDEVSGTASGKIVVAGAIKINEGAPAPLDKDGKPKPAVSLVGKTVATTVVSRMEAKEQTVVIHGDKNVELGGEVIAHHVHAEVKEGDLDLAQGSKITIDELSGTASGKITVAGAIKINEGAPAPLGSDGKPAHAIFLRGKSVEAAESSNIEAKGKDVLIRADEEVTLSGNMTAHRLDGLAIAGHVHVTKQSNVTSKQVYYDAKSIDYEGTTFLQDGLATSPDDTGPFFAARSSTLHMNDQGHIDTDSKESVVSLKAASGSLGGHIHAPVLKFEIDTLSSPDVENLLQRTGRYSDIAPSDSIDISTLSELALDREMNFSYSVRLTGSSVGVTSNIYSSKDLCLTSTVGDVSTRHCMLRADHVLAIDAKHSFDNERGALFADTMLIHAHDGDIINRAGVLQASTYLQGITDHGSIYNIGEERAVQADSYVMKVYDSARMSGGSGAGHDGYGLLLESGGKIINQGSFITSASSSVLDAKAGVDNIAVDYSYQKPGHSLGFHFTPPNDFAIWGSFFPVFKLPDVTVTQTQSASIGSANKTVITTDHGNIYNDRGVIAGTETMLDAKEDSIINRSGILQASGYLELKAEHGDIQNLCTESDVRGAYDTMKAYHLGHMLGGTGAGHDGIGFYADAGGRFVNDASEISSIGSNYIVGEHGIDLEARKHTYVSYHRHTRTWYGKSIDKTDYSTQVQPSVIFSLQGKNTLLSTDGGIHSVATQMVAASGTDLSAKANIDLYGIRGVERQHHSSSNFWGLGGSSSTETCDDFVVPTTLASLGDVHLISLGNINAGCAAITTPGRLEFKGHDINLSGEVLNHRSLRDTWSWNFIGPSLPGLNGTSVYQDIQALGSASSSMGRATAVSNTLLDSLNSFNNIIGGMRSGSLAQAICPFSSMTVAQAELSHTVSKSSWQTLAPNVGYQCESLFIDAENAVSFSKGIPIYVSGNARIHAKRFDESGVGLKSSTHTVSESLGVGLSAEGRLTGSASVGVSGSESTTYAHQNFYVGGTLAVDVDEWNITDANVIAGSLTGHVKRLSILTHSDTSSSYGYSAQVSTNGGYSYHHDTARSSTIATPSGIEVRGKTDFETKETYLEGSKLLFDGETHFRTDHLTSRTVNVYSHSSNFGLCGNADDLAGDTHSRQWTQPIPTIGLHGGKQNYVAEQMGTVWSRAAGDGVVMQSVDGALHTTDAGGLMVKRSEQDSYEFKIPLYHSGGLTQIENNIGWTRDKVYSILPTPKEYLIAESKEPISHGLYAASHREAKHHERTSAEIKMLDAAERTISEVDENRKVSVALISKEATLFAHRSSLWPLHGDAPSSGHSKWDTDSRAISKWQGFWKVVDELNREDEIAIDVINQVGRTFDPRNIWAEVKRDSADLDWRIANGKIFSREALSDAAGMAAGMASLVPIGKGVKVGEEALSSGINRFFAWKENAVTSLISHDIRYSQESVSYLKIRDGMEPYTLDDIAKSMSENGWRGSPVDIVRMPEGGYSTLDNTRILAAQRAGIDVKVNIHKYNGKLPDNMLDRFEHPALPGLYAETWGEALEYRISKQSLNFQNKYYPLGTYQQPKVTYPKIK
jgi:adhesin HecA-like repeat protein